MEKYNIFKRLVPKYFRTTIRDLDRAYQQRLEEIESKNQQIIELENSYQELLKLFYEQKNMIKQQSQEIESKNQQITQLEDSILSDQDYQKLSEQGLFLVGNARSGTSMLCDLLNLSPDVFLLGEANIFLHHHLDNFVDFFNNQHLRFKNPKRKGKFAPPCRLPEKGAFNFLFRMNKNHKFVGEKIAFGPHGKFGNQSFQEVFFNFHVKYFYFSNYILIMRRPTECIWSTLKMFPHRGLDVIVDCWLRTIQIQIDVFHTFPNGYIIFFEDVNNQTLMNLCSFIGININIPEGFLREEDQHSLLAQDEIPEALSQYSELCLACEKIFQQVKNEFDPETFKLKQTNYDNGFTHKIYKQINEIIDNLPNFLGTT